MTCFVTLLRYSATILIQGYPDETKNTEETYYLGVQPCQPHGAFEKKVLPCPRESGVETRGGVTG